MDDTLRLFLESLLSPVGAGILLWGVMAFIIKAAPGLNNNSEAKFWITFVLAFVIPPGAYLLQVVLGYTALTVEGLFLAIGVSYMLSQGVHRGTEKLGEALNKQ